MTEASYIRKFERVVDLMRTVGVYSATQDGTSTIYTMVSTVPHLLSVDAYVLLDYTTKVRVTAITTPFIFKIDGDVNIIPDSGVWKSLAPYSGYGTRKTIDKALLEKNSYGFQFQKYPLIALRLPSKVSKDGDVYSADANILLATFTSKTRNPSQRLDTTFEPILYPLRDHFLRMLKMSGEYLNFRFEPDQYDRMFYGTESGDTQNIANVFSDPLDAIELRNLKLNYLEDCSPSQIVVQAYGDSGFEYVFENVFES